MVELLRWCALSGTVPETTSPRIAGQQTRVVAADLNQCSPPTGISRPEAVDVEAFVTDTSVERLDVNRGANYIPSGTVSAPRHLPVTHRYAHLSRARRSGPLCRGCEIRFQAAREAISVDSYWPVSSVRGSPRWSSAIPPWCYRTRAPAELSADAVTAEATSSLPCPSAIACRQRVSSAAVSASWSPRSCAASTARLASLVACRSGKPGAKSPASIALPLSVA